MRAALSALLVVSMLSPLAIGQEARKKAHPKPATSPAYQVVVVADPRTIIITMDGRTRKVRLIGAGDASPTKLERRIQAALMTRARDYLREALDGQSVRIERDPAFPPLSDGTIPAYAFREEDGAFLNHELVAKGLLAADLKKPFKRRAEIEAAQSEARDSKAGIWSPDVAEDLPNRPEPEPEPEPQVIKQYRPHPSARPGDIVYLHDTTGAAIYVATDWFAFEDLRKFRKAKDWDGIAQQLEDSEVAKVDEDTKVRFLETKSIVSRGAAEVRILDGPFEGIAVWFETKNLFDRREVVRRRR